MSGEAILCVDDEEQVRGLIARVVRSAGHECVCVDSVEKARVALRERSFSAVLCDIGLPGSSGLDLLAEVARSRPDIAIVMVTGRDDPAIAEVAVELGAYGYVTKPFAPNELLLDLSNALHRRKLEAGRRVYEESLEETVAARTKQLEEAVSRLERSESELRRAYGETVNRLGRAIEYRDLETGAHVGRVGSYAHTIAVALAVDPAWAELLRLASPLHDIGKIAIPDVILLKHGPLEIDERQAMERHTEIGRDLLAGSGNELLDLAATVAWTHHERWDGHGYPRGLAGEEIPLEGRIVAVADVFDALASDRPYRLRLPLGKAREHIAANAGTAFDPGVAAALLGSFGDNPGNTGDDGRA